MFFVKYNDPIYVKLEKLDIMIRLASQANIAQVRSWGWGIQAYPKPSSGWGSCPTQAARAGSVPHSPGGFALLPGSHCAVHPSGAGRTEGICHGGGCGFCQEGSESHRPLCHQGGGEGWDTLGLVAPLVGQGSTFQYMVAISSQEFASWSLLRHEDEP